MRIAPEVTSALATSSAVVALESTIFSHLGLPSPSNRHALEACLGAIRAGGATPALTAVLDGVPVVGVPADRHDIICGPARKVSGRDLGVAVAQGWGYGATTVSASLALAAAAGVTVFATGGIGGVHRDVSTSSDVSADLSALANHQVVTVSSGAKVFLDLARTLEELETRSVPVLGYRCDEFPAFYSRSSGLAVPHRVESAEEIAAVAHAHWSLGGGGILVTNPVPDGAAIEPSTLDAAVVAALARADRGGVSGASITPLVLAEIAEQTGGRSIASNVALAEANARLGAEIAVAVATH